MHLRWLVRLCGYKLYPEPLGRSVVESQPEVIDPGCQPLGGDIEEVQPGIGIVFEPSYIDDSVALPFLPEGDCNEGAADRSIRDVVARCVGQAEARMDEVANGVYSFQGGDADSPAAAGDRPVEESPPLFARCPTTAGGTAGGGGAAGEQRGGFLDRSVAGGGGTVGIAPLEAIYTVGDLIHAGFRLADAAGNDIPDAAVSCTLVAVTLGEKGESYAIINIRRFEYDPDTGLYFLDIPTEGLTPGIYDLWLGFDDGTAKRLRIQLIPAKSD